MTMPETWEVLAWEGLDHLTRPQPTSPPPPSPSLTYKPTTPSRGFWRDMLSNLGDAFRSPDEVPPPTTICEPTMTLPPTSPAPSPRPLTWDDVIGNATAVEIRNQERPRPV